MIGSTLSHYKILSKLGEGGMGEVYLAQDTELDRKVALKLLPAEMAEDPERLERFRREAKAVAALNHPNIVTIHSIEEAEGRRFLTMELVEGDSLDRVITAEGLPLPKIFDIAVPISEALTAAHEGGIVHRDLKPANVMVTPDGRVKVLDFGLAKLATEAALPAEDAATEAALTGEGTVMGTAPYMSPEQLQGHAVDHRTDIFSLGVLLYEMATGRRPFQGDSGIALASSILKDSPPTVTDVRTGLPRHLGRIVNHCLEKEPRRRFQSALDVRNELDSLHEEVTSGASQVVSEPVPAAPSPPAPVSSAPVETAAPADPTPATTPPTPTTPPTTVTSGPVPATPANRVGTWIGIAAVLLAVAGVAWWMGRSSDDSPSTPPAAAEAPATEAVPAQPRRVAQGVEAGPSLAVLPFTDMSPGGEQEYFTDGLTIELINQLSQVDDLRVIGRRSAFQFKGSNDSLRSIGEQLSVSAILEGSVRKAGDQVRITAELVNTEDEFQLWSETYDRTLEDIFTIQDEIASSVARALEVTLLGKSATRRAANLEAHNLMLQSRFLMARGETGDTQKALGVLEEALEIDSAAPRIWADFGLAQMRLGFQSQTGDERDRYMKAALDSLNKALTLDPGLAEAHSRIGWLELSYRMDFAAAEVANRRALELAPNNLVVLANAATVSNAMGRSDEAIAFDQKVMSIEPMDLIAKSNASGHYLQADKLDEAEALIREVLGLSPGYFRARSLLGAVLLAKGQPQAALQEYLQEADASFRLLGKAIAEFDLGEREASDRSLAEFSQTFGDEQPYNVALIHAYRGEIDEAFRLLEIAYEASAAGLPFVKVSRFLANLHDDPRWPVFLEKMGLAD